MLGEERGELGESLRVEDEQDVALADLGREGVYLVWKHENDVSSASTRGGRVVYRHVGLAVVYKGYLDVVVQVRRALKRVALDVSAVKSRAFVLINGKHIIPPSIVIDNSLP